MSFNIVDYVVIFIDVLRNFFTLPKTFSDFPGGRQAGSPHIGRRQSGQQTGHFDIGAVSSKKM